MKLAELQRQMLADVMRPLTRGDRTAKTIAAAYIKPNARLTARQRLGIYNRQYWLRLVDSLRDDFPGLLRILGERRFVKLMIGYLSECPSRSFTLRDLGRSLPGWLARYGNGPELTVDMAMLEWAHIETWDTAESQPLRPEDLSVLTPDLPLGLQPHIRLLIIHYAVDDVRLGNLSVRAAARRHPRTICLATHRVNGEVFYRRLEPGEFALLQKLSAGKPLSKALRGFTGAPEDLQRWFATWAQLGWLCRPVR